MQVKIKKLHPDAVIPKYAKSGDAGLDLVATSKFYDEFGNVHYGTGLAFEIPLSYVGLLFPRSSNCKFDLILSNSVGILDSGYRGEVAFKFKPSIFFTEWVSEETEARKSETFDEISIPGKEDNFFEYKIGDRIGQILIIPYFYIEFQEVDELSDTVRGVGGFGSSGK